MYTNYTTEKTRILSKNVENRKIKMYIHTPIEGYPNDVEKVVSEEGFGKNDYIETTKSLIVVTAPGPGSGKMATCLSQLYHENKKGISAGYAKYETFPIWSIPLKHPVNLAYEAATIDLNDVIMIDPFHLEAYDKIAVNYNRDVEVFPLLKAIFEKIYGKSPYNSPTDMGVNMAGFAIKNDEAACKASKEEIIRRYYQTLKYNYYGKFADECVDKAEMLMNQVGISKNDRKCVSVCLKKQEKENVPVIALELKNGKVITGKRSLLFGAPAALLLNALKSLAKIDDSLTLIARNVIDPIQKLKVNDLKNHNPRLHAEEVLIALAIQATTNTLSELALSQLPKLKGCQAHSSIILPESDLKTFKKLGIEASKASLISLNNSAFNG